MIHISTGNAKTIILEDKNESHFFWSNSFTHSYLNGNDTFLLENRIDLMGNPLLAIKSNPKKSSALHK